jgi:hypothetical protein
MAHPILQKFVYSPLTEKRDFRLVTLHHGTDQDPISLTICHASLDQAPPYEALSYVWGPQNPSETIKCNDGSLEIGKNLSGALRCLRKPTMSRVLWIDRVAINQENVKERTSQVGLMADIYSLAAKVAVWLGPADSSTESALAFLDDISTQMRENKEPQDSSEPFKFGSENHAIKYPPSGDSIWAGVKSLLQRPWFSRAWTFQEIILARKADIYCGVYHSSWQSIENVLVCLKAYPPGTNMEDLRLIGDDKLLTDIYKARAMLQRPQLFSLEDKDAFLSLFPLLDGMRTRNATDPRDKVFALLNIACDLRDSELEADYSKSHAEVYAMTAKWLLRRTKSLAFLSLVEKKDKPDLISWVPDFRYKDQMNFLHQPLQIWRGKDRMYNASGTTRVRFDVQESLFQLTVQGIYVGTIVEQTEPPGNMLNNVALGARVLDGGEWQTFAGNCAVDGVYPPTGESMELAYRRLIIWDRIPGESLARNQRKCPPTLMDLPKPGIISYSGAKKQIFGPSEDIAMYILRGTSRKKLFKMDTGYVGLAHRSCEVGDRVYVLMGGDTPFVLRSLGGSFYGFGGESYVHGIMDGEMLALAMGDDRSLTRNTRKGLDWIDELGEEPWPFKTEVLTLV